MVDPWGAQGTPGDVSVRNQLHKSAATRAARWQQQVYATVMRAIE